MRRLLVLALFAAGLASAQQAEDLDRRLDAIEHVHEVRPWQESQAQVEALRREGLSGANLSQRTRLDLIEARNRLLAGEFDTALNQLDAVLARPVAIDQRLRALELAANASGIEQQYGLAFNYLYEALKLLPESDDSARRAALLVLASRFHALAGEQAMAMEYISESLVAAEAAGEPRTRCFAEQDLIYLQIRTGLTGVAVETADRMWSTCQPTGDPVLIGSGMMAMGAALLHAGRHEEATGWLRRAEAQHRQSDFGVGVAESRYYLGLARLGAGDADRGIELLRDSVEHFESLQAWNTLIDLHGALADAHEQRGEYGQALEQLRAQLRADQRFNEAQRTLRVAYQQAEFENQRQQQALVLLRQRNALFELERQTEASRQRARSVAVVMAGVIALLLAGLLIRFRADRKRFRRLSERDGLTGLFNHSRFHRAAEAQLRAALAADRPCTLIAADVDLFKSVNDRYGHQAGDAVLIRIGQWFQSVFPPPAVLGRVGGEEFAVFLPNANRLQARQKVETLRRTLEPVVCGDERIEVTLSFGIAEGRREPRLERLRMRADEALYRAKRSGRNELVDAADLSDADDA